MADGKLALVTGASSGIGEAFARRLARDGWRVVLCARRRERLEVLARELGGEVHVMPADLSTSGGVVALWAQLEVAELPAPDLLVNNAGFGVLKRFQECDREQMLECVGLNVAAVVDLTHRVLEAQVKRGSGAVINVASTAAFQAVPYYAVYGATKAFVLSFTEALSVDLAGTGVKVQALCPGGTRTEFLELAGVDPKKAEKTGTMMEPAEVVDASMNALAAGRVVCVPGAINNVGVFANRLAPRALSTRVAGWLLEKTR